ncbi:MAG TPA: dienelactone hydrolase family protein [Candidatus Eisenbacteria bacterium]|nr:dienelactone hydrolase family protein [Candidatus Eisenbacteria bacterium]
MALNRDDVAVEDLSFGGAGEAVEAYLVRPAGAAPAGRHPGLVMWHWLDTEAPDGNRTEFLEEARSLAGRGVVSLLPQGRFPWRIDPSGAAPDAKEVEAEVARFRAAVDFLVEVAGVDPGCVAAAGHDFGAMLAILATASDPRISGVVAMTPTPRWADWFLPFWAIAEDRIDYLAAMRRLDPVERIAGIAPRPILLQLADRDFYVAPMAGFELRRAAGESSAVELKRYDAQHGLRHPDAVADREEFLARVLNLQPEVGAAPR